MEGRMWPIQGLSKAKRLKWGAPQNHVSWAFMTQLRERDRYVRVYDVCPYIEVYPFRENVYGLFNQNCDGAGDVWMYVVIGPEKAMVIDTGFGIGNVKGLVDELTGGMPLVVANTHSGPDHCMGNVRFERVYCHKYCVPNITRKCAPGAWDYLFDQDGNNIWLQFDKQDVPQYRDYELIPVENHHMFNLGGDHNVELVWQPGHDSGHAMFLDHKTRILFAGDDVCSDVIACGSGGRGGGREGRRQLTCSNFGEIVLGDFPDGLDWAWKVKKTNTDLPIDRALHEDGTGKNYHMGLGFVPRYHIPDDSTD